MAGREFPSKVGAIELFGLMGYGDVTPTASRRHAPGRKSILARHCDVIAESVDRCRSKRQAWCHRLPFATTFFEGS